MKVIRDNTSKKDIVQNICAKIGLPAVYVKRIIDDLITILILGIKKNNVTKIKDFGTFFLKKKNTRKGRNPKNNINHVIAERNVVTFKSAEDLKKRVNKNATKKD